VGKFIELQTKKVNGVAKKVVDKETMTLLENLKKNKIPKALPSSNTFKFNVREKSTFFSKTYSL
jgi:hypothetical protein